MKAAEATTEPGNYTLTTFAWGTRGRDRSASPPSDPEVRLAGGGACGSCSVTTIHWIVITRESSACSQYPTALTDAASTVAPCLSRPLSIQLRPPGSLSISYNRTEPTATQMLYRTSREPSKELLSRSKRPRSSRRFSATYLEMGTFVALTRVPRGFTPTI